MKTAIVWFTTDLRLHDNETLITAIAQNDRVIPVYCFQDSEYRTTELGFRKTGAIRTQFILQSLLDLDSNLRQLGSGLLIVRGAAAEELTKLVIQYNATAIYTKAEAAPDELTTQKEVENMVNPLNCVLKTFNTNTLFHPADLPFQTQLVPDIFTAFRTKVERECKVRAVSERPDAISSPSLPEIQLPALSDLRLEPVQIDDRAAINFHGGETSALERMHYYFAKSKLVSTYKETRNQLVGADYSTKFSAWLSLGCISPRYIFHMLKEYEAQYGANDSTYWVIFELLWRDYFWLMMKKYGRKFFLKQGIKGVPTKAIAHNREALMSWVNGKTGVDFVDANMLELKLTGFMSNRGRQNVASYFCHDLKLDWRLGAAYFEEQLIDYDVCSNWGNWAYIAGVGNDPRPDRYFNLKKQADQYDADKKFRNLWLSEL